MFLFVGLGALFGGAKPTKAPRGGGTAWWESKMFSKCNKKV